jgi:hypothetical protein
MEDERLLKNRLLMGNFTIKEQWGKPRTRWEDVIQKDTSQILGRRG